MEQRLERGARRRAQVCESPLVLLQVSLKMIRKEPPQRVKSPFAIVTPFGDKERPPELNEGFLMPALRLERGGKKLHSQ